MNPLIKFLASTAGPHRAAPGRNRPDRLGLLGLGGTVGIILAVIEPWRCSPASSISASSHPVGNPLSGKKNPPRS